MTEKHVAKWQIVALIFSSIVLTATAAKITDDQTTKVVKEEPIIINTVAQHYKNPTIDEYQLCTKSRDDCISKCGSSDDTCKTTCPVCPILIDQDILVQGINDTLYRLPITSGKVNQTNIIRLTNEIRNIFENHLGNITTNNQNNINVYQNSSRTGGKFGLGYTEKGPCCHVIEPQRCRRSTTGPRCSHRRQRICGSQCISRVVRAKRVVTCSETDPDDCTQSVEYLPQPRRPGCQYTSTYPYINCKTSTQHNVARRSNCARCYAIPYLNVMRGDVPRSCLQCYGRTGGQQRSRPFYQPAYQPAPTYYGGPYAMYPQYQTYYPPSTYYRNYGNDWTVIDDDDADEFELTDSDNGWKVEARKCRNEDGTVAENCPPDTNDGDDISPIAHDVEESPDDDIDPSEGLDYDYGDDDFNYRGLPQSRRRYRRSKHF